MAQTPEGARKAAITRRKKYGRDHYKRVGAARNKSSTPRHFSKLKAEDPEKHRELSSEGGKKGIRHFKKLSEENPEKFRKISAKGGKKPKRLSTELRRSRQSKEEVSEKREGTE